MINLTAGSPSRPDDLSSYQHRQLIGWVGLLLPLLLIAMVVARDGVERWRALESISAYYYTGAVAAFVGMLVTLSLFLLTYRGYANDWNNADRITAAVAGLAALVVAFFPTRSPSGVPALSWWTESSGILHHSAATVLFLAFAVFALWLFRLGAPGQIPTPDKKLRNTVYLVCGVVIVGMIGWAAYNGMNGKAIFLPESIALVAFSVSWVVKGYAHRTIGALFHAPKR